MTAISFKQFLLNEEVITDKQEMIERIKTECKPFLDEIDFRVNPSIEHASSITYLNVPRALWRGISNDGALIKLSGNRPRFPSDTSPYMHELLVRYFAKHFGYPYRSMGVFCSSAREQAAEYGGNLFIIFPIGEYEYVFSPEIKDAYMSFDNSQSDYPKMWNEIITNMGKRESDYQDDIGDIRYEKWFDLVYDYLEKNTPYTNSNLKAFLDMRSDDGAEIIVKCDNYYALDVGAAHRRNAIDVLMGISK